MFDSVAEAEPAPLDPAKTATPRMVAAGSVTGWADALAASTTGDDEVSDAERMELVGALERLKCAAEGLQAGLAAATVDHQRTIAERVSESERAALRAVSRVPSSVGHQVALARRISPAAGRRLVQLALLLRAQHPRVYRALRRGATTEWTASQIARETVVLSAEHRAQIDQELTAEPDTITLLGVTGAPARARQLAAELDPAAVVARRRLAESERRVSLRPAPDGMTWLSALLPLKEGVATWAALGSAADTARASGDPRTRGQIMADELAARVVNSASGTVSASKPSSAHAPADDAGGGAGGWDAGDGGNVSDRATTWHTPFPAPVSAAPTSSTGAPRQRDDHEAAETAVERPDRPSLTGPGLGIVINVIMTSAQLFGSGPDSEGTAWCEGYGPIDIDLARELARGNASAGDRIWIRRLYTDSGGRLVGIDRHARYFRHTIRHLIKLRDQTCRTPWCTAPIRHIDHVTDHADGGETTLVNGQGNCEACNHAKQANGWHASADPVTGVVSVTTPSGQRYGSLPPPPPGARRPKRDSIVELIWLAAEAA